MNMNMNRVVGLAGVVIAFTCLFLQHFKVVGNFPAILGVLVGGLLMAASTHEVKENN